MGGRNRPAARAASLAVVIVGAALVALHAQAPVTAILGGTVIDGNGGEPIRDAAIVVSGERITAIGPRASVTIPAGANRIDASGQWIIPGMIDTNVHLSLYGDRTSGTRRSSATSPASTTSSSRRRRSI